MGVAINNAGNVRNYGMSFVETEWIAFLDDDDIIADDYLEKFYEEPPTAWSAALPFSVEITLS